MGKRLDQAGEVVGSVLRYGPGAALAGWLVSELVVIGVDEVGEDIDTAVPMAAGVVVRRGARALGRQFDSPLLKTIVDRGGDLAAAGAGALAGGMLEEGGAAKGALLALLADVAVQLPAEVAADRLAGVKY